MKKYRISKYDPTNRNEEGHYLYNHWTEISDVGKILEGELVTKEAYFEMEGNYIRSVIEILKESNQDYLRLVGFDKDQLKHSLKNNYKEWFHEEIFDNIELFEDKKVYLDEISTLIQLNFRNYLDTSLEIKDKFYVHFGFDFYMYVGVPNMSIGLVNKLNSTMVFVEPFWSPRYSSQLEYVVLINVKESMFVSEEIVLENISVERMKEIFGLSKDHPGTVYTVLSQEISEELELDVDFELFDYRLTTELIIE